MSYVVYEISTWQRIKARNGAQTFSTEAAAKRVLTHHVKKHGKDAAAYRDLFAIDTYDNWAASDPIVETYNLLDPDKKPVKIRLSEKGSCCDPATERYHSM